MELMPDPSLHITREVFESSVTMAKLALLALGVDKGKAAEAVAEFRRRDRTRLKAQFKSGDMHAGAQHSFGGADSDDLILDEG